MSNPLILFFQYIHEVEATYSAFLFVVVGAGFCLYGTKLLIVLRKQQQMTFITKRVRVFALVVYTSLTIGVGVRSYHSLYHFDDAAIYLDIVESICV